MDVVYDVEVVCAVLRQLEAESYGESYIRRVKKKVEATSRNLQRNLITSAEVVTKLENLFTAVYKMEDLLETSVRRRIHARRMGFGRRYIFIFLTMLNLKARIKLRREMKHIIPRIYEITKFLMNIKESGVSRREESNVVIGLGEQKESTLILAMMNSDRLSFGLRPCLLYFGLFPRGYQIPVRRLLRLWLAEGFVTESREQTERMETERIPWDLEKNAEIYLHELLDRGIIRITEWRKDGSPKTCKMPEIIYDICLSKAKDVFGLLQIHPTVASPKFGVRRVAEHGDIKDYSHKDSRIQNLRSYLSFNTQSKDTPAVEIGNFLSTEVIGHRGFGLLRLLDLERVYKPDLPHNLGQLYLLRYLGLRWTFLDTLPRSVSKLRFLETLDVKHTYISSPPNSIWKMNNLRYLCLNEIRLDMPMKKRSNISLTGLHTLWGLFVDINSPVKNGLDGLINLKKLGLTFHLDSIEKLNVWIRRLVGLECLRLRSKDENGQPSNLKLMPLSSLKNLTNVYLLGKLPELSINYFPKSIKVLTLSVSKLKKDPMPILAKLPKLYVLRLLADSYTGKEMVWPREGFPELNILKLWMLKELETWTVEEGAISVLSELEIRCCHKLKKLSLPLNFSWKIVLRNMPKELEDNLRVRADYYCDDLSIETGFTVV